MLMTIKHYCSLPVLCLSPVLKFLFSTSLFPVNRSQLTSALASSQLYSGGGGASQPRSKHVSEGNSLRDVAPGNHVHVSYVGE